MKTLDDEAQRCHGEGGAPNVPPVGNSGVKPESPLAILVAGLASLGANGAHRLARAGAKEKLFYLDLHY